MDFKKLNNEPVFVLVLQEETGSTVLAAKDYLDDGTPINLKVEISEKDVSTIECSVVCNS